MSDLSKAFYDLIASKEFDRVFTEVTRAFDELAKIRKSTRYRDDCIVCYEVRSKADGMKIFSAEKVEDAISYICAEFGVEDRYDAPVYIAEVHDYDREHVRPPIEPKDDRPSDVCVRKRLMKMDFVEMASDDEIMEVNTDEVFYDDSGDAFDECPLYNGKGRGAECQYTFKDCDNYGHMGSLPCEKCNEYLTEQLRNKIKERKEKIKQKRINRQVI